jgi:uncharacterized membrane protein
MNAAAAPTAAVRRTRALAVTATIALIVLGLAVGALARADRPRHAGAQGAAAAAAASRVCWRLHLYTYRWTSLAVWLYIAEGATRAGSERGISATLAMLEIVSPWSCSRRAASTSGRDCGPAPRSLSAARVTP